MTKEEFDSMLLAVVKSGVTVGMSYRDGAIHYDMNTGMKSDLSISWKDEACVAKGRYDHVATIEGLEDLICEVRGCDRGRGFMNAEWGELLGATK